MVQTTKETANIMEYKFGNNANIANFVFVKTPSDKFWDKNFITVASKIIAKVRRQNLFMIQRLCRKMPIKRFFHAPHNGHRMEM